MSQTRVRCDSGIEGYQNRLREDYSSYQEWQYYANMYGLHSRLGFNSPRQTWRKNPLIQGSVVPRDFCRVFRQPRENEDLDCSVS